MNTEEVCQNEKKYTGKKYSVFWFGWHMFCHRCRNFMYSVKYHLGGKMVFVVLLFFSAGILIFFQYLRFLIIYGGNTAKTFEWASIFSYDELGKVLVLYFLILLIYGLRSSRSRIVIEEFEDTTSDAGNFNTKYIPSLLIVEIQKINQLYLDVDEQRPIPSLIGQRMQVSAVLKVDDTGELLNDVVSTDARLSFGPLVIPIGLFFSIFNILSRGPRIRGNLHKSKEEVVLLASLTGPDMQFGWKITSTPIISGEGCANGERSLELMVHELACRIFTDIPSRGSVKWEATDNFNEGLKKYRECLRSPKDKVNQLGWAEYYFKEALVHDTSFTTAWYNLGVVYLEQGHTSAAERVFFEALKQDPRESYAYHALASIEYQRIKRIRFFSKDKNDKAVRDHISKVLRYCKHVNDILEHNYSIWDQVRYWCQGWHFTNLFDLIAKNYNLAGLTYLEIAKISGPDQKKASQLSIERAIFSHMKAIAAARKGYSSVNICEIDNDFYTKRKWLENCHLLVQCISDLGWTHIYAAKKLGDGNYDFLKIADTLFCKAQSLNHDLQTDCACSELWWRRGILSLYRKEPGVKDSICKAFREIDTAIQINPKVMKYHAVLALLSVLKKDQPPRSDSYGLENALHLALKAHADEEWGRDDQWQSLEEIQNLVAEYNPSMDTTRHFFSQIKMIYRFLTEIREISRYLDAYSQDNAEKVSAKIDNLITGYNRGILKMSGELEISEDSVMNWIQGYISFIEGRTLWLDEEYQEFTEKKTFRQAEEKFLDACRYFRNFPEEITFLNLHARIAVLQVRRGGRNYDKGFFNSETGHLMNPASDYEHAIQAMIFFSMQDYHMATERWKEALQVCYGFSEFSRFILSNYLQDLSVSSWKLADYCQDQGEKIKYFDSALKCLENAREFIQYEYQAIVELREEFQSYRDLKSKNNYLEEDLAFIESVRYNDAIIGVQYWTGIFHFLKKDYPKAAYYLEIVKGFTRPPDSCTIPSKIPWMRYQDYLITLLQLGDLYRNWKNYAASRKYYLALLEYRDQIEFDIKREIKNYGRLMREEGCPQELLLRADLGLAQIFTMHYITSEHTGNSSHKMPGTNLSESWNVQELLEDACKQFKSIDDTTEYGEFTKKRFEPELYQLKGVASFVFRTPESVIEDCDSAITFLKTAISLNPLPKCYVYLLKALEQKIDALTDAKLKKDCMNEGIRYCEVVRMMDISKEDKKYVEKFSKKLKALSKNSVPEKIC